MQTKLLSGMLAATLLLACGGDKRKPTTSTYESPPPGTGEPITDEELAEINAGDRREFDEMMGKRVMDRGARKVKHCHAAGAPATEGEVTVIFDGTKGRVTDVELDYLLDEANADGKRCIKQSWVGEYVPPFDGTKKITKTITIPENPDKEDKKEGDKK